jgi:hypothetical protein
MKGHGALWNDTDGRNTEILEEEPFPVPIYPPH